MRAPFRFSIRELLLVTAVVGLAIALFRSEYERSRPFQATEFLNRLDIKKTLQRIAASEGRSQSIIATGGLLSAGEYGGTYTLDSPVSLLSTIREEIKGELLKNGCIIIDDRREGWNKDYMIEFALKYRCGRTAPGNAPP